MVFRKAGKEMSLKDKIKFKKENGGYYMHVGKDFSIGFDKEAIDFARNLSKPFIKFERKNN